jgi:TRAP-type transport system periplasmic protein
MLKRCKGVVLAAALAAAVPAMAADFTMKIGFATMNDVQHQWANWYKEALEARSKGRIAVNLFPRNQLGPIASQIEGLQLGTVEAFTTPADFFAGMDPRFGTFSIPLLFKNPEHAEKVLLDPSMNKEILALGADKNVQVVSVYTYAPAHYFGKQPIRSLDDFKGKKLRVNATAAERAKMRQFGASAVPMDLSEVVPGIQQGVIDGTMSAAAVYVNLKFGDIGKVLTEVNDTMIVSIGVVSRPWLAKLQARINPHSRVLDQGMVKRWREAGGELVKLPAADQARVEQLLAGVGEEVTKDHPGANVFYKRLVATGKKY